MTWECLLENIETGYEGLKRIYRILEYSFEIIERIFVRFQTNIHLSFDSIRVC